MSRLQGLRLVIYLYRKCTTHKDRQVWFVLKIKICSLSREVGTLLALDILLLKICCATG